jgi:hypothetical protein
MDRKSKKEESAIREILEEMFRRVGATYSPDLTSKAEWYRAHEWTLVEEHDFIKWLTAYMQKKRLLYSATTAKRAAEMFVFQHGWKLSDIIDTRDLIKGGRYGYVETAETDGTGRETRKEGGRS